MMNYLQEINEKKRGLQGLTYCSTIKNVVPVYLWIMNLIITTHKTNKININTSFILHRETRLYLHYVGCPCISSLLTSLKLQGIYTDYVGGVVITRLNKCRHTMNEKEYTTTFFWESVVNHWRPLVSLQLTNVS